MSEPKVYSLMGDDELLRACEMPSLLSDGQNRILVPLLAERLKRAIAALQRGRE